MFHRIKPLLFEWELSACYIAGGCFTDTVNDIDVFPVDTAEFSSVLNRCKDLKTKPIYESKNALTFQCDGIRVQLCNYCYPTLEALVDSFDFAHIQVGAYIYVRCTCVVRIHQSHTMASAHCSHTVQMTINGRCCRGAHGTRCMM